MVIHPSLHLTAVYLYISPLPYVSVMDRLPPAGCFAWDWIFWLMIYWWWAAAVERRAVIKKKAAVKVAPKEKRIMDSLHFCPFHSSSIILSYAPTRSVARPLSLFSTLHLHFRFAPSRPTTPPAGFCFWATVLYHLSISLSLLPHMLDLSGHETAGMVSVRAVYEIAQVKSQDESFKMQDASMQTVVKSIIGSARSLGIKIVNEWESRPLCSCTYIAS